MNFSPWKELPQPWKEEVNKPHLAAAGLGMILCYLSAGLLAAKFGISPLSAQLGASASAAVWALLILRPGGSLSSGHWCRNGIKSALAGFFLIEVLTFSVTPLWKIALEHWEVSFEEQQFLVLLLQGKDLQTVLTVFLLTVLLVPLTEELFFRRILFGLFRGLGSWTALLIGAAVFAGAHNFLLGLPALFCMGVIFQILYCRSGNFFVPVLCHMLVNTFAFAGALLFQQP